MLAMAVVVKRDLSRLRTVLQSDLFWKGLRPLETLTVFMNRMLFRESKGVLNMTLAQVTCIEFAFTCTILLHILQIFLNK